MKMQGLLVKCVYVALTMTSQGLYRNPVEVEGYVVDADLMDTWEVNFSHGLIKKGLTGGLNYDTLQVPANDCLAIQRENDDYIYRTKRRKPENTIDRCHLSNIPNSGSDVCNRDHRSKDS